MTNRPIRKPRQVRDPYGLGATATYLAPGLAIVGLVVIGLLTFSLFNGQLPFVGARGPGDSGGDNPNPNITPAPSNVVIVDPRADVKGEIVYAKAGSIWIQSGTSVRQLTKGAQDSTPAFSVDGKLVYFIRTVSERGLRPVFGTPSYYTMTYPRVMKVPTDGSASPSQVATGKYSFGPGGKYQWFYWISQPTPSPDGKTLTVVSDGPDPTQTDVVVQSLNLQNRRLTNLNLGQSFHLGQQDPAWRPDGKILAYVRNGRDGSRGAPTIWRYDPKSKGSSQMTGPGYEDPSFSPDLKYVAATHTTPVGTDVVILDARTGGELLSITTDGRAWAPVWSPAGDSIAYLHIVGQIVDLKLTKLNGPGPAFTAGDTIDLTNVSGLDGSSRPGWFIPSDGTPAASPSAGGAGSAGSGTESVSPTASQ